MVICDTNIVIELFKNNLQVRDKFTEIGTNDLAISTVTAGEFYFGAFNKEEMLRIIRHLRNYTILDFNSEITHIFLALMQQYSLSHRPFIGDMIIAATALFYNCQLFTLNTKDFRFIPELKLIGL